jgi:hypothetical protein
VRPVHRLHSCCCCCLAVCRSTVHSNCYVTYPVDAS